MQKKVTKREKEKLVDEWNKALIAKYNAVIKDGDFKSIIWDRISKEFVVTR